MKIYDISQEVNLIYPRVVGSFMGLPAIWIGYCWYAYWCSVSCNNLSFIT